MSRATLRPIHFALAACLWLAAATAAAHDPGLSSLHARIDGDRLELQLLVNDTDLGGLSLDARALRVEADGSELSPERVESIAAPQLHSAARLTYALPAAAGALRVDSLLFEQLPRGHKQLARLERAGGSVADRLLSRGAAGFDVALEDATAPAGHRARDFFRLGVEHIAAGADHLLFLFALLVSCQRLGAIARVVTAFTLSHSLTLALVTLGGLSVPGRIVEPAIAASIVVVAALNLRRGSHLRERVGLSFVFGLVHGAGFATLLADLGVAALPGGPALPLVAFNLGVEAGQIAIACAVLPLFAWARRQPLLARRWVPALSGAVGSLGIVWCLQRLAGA